MHSIRRMTVILSQDHLPEDGAQRLCRQGEWPEQVDLFCLAAATRLLQADFSAWPPGERLFCAHNHQQLAAEPPPPGSPFVAAGLASLGRLIRDSQVTLALPAARWPETVPTVGVKDIAIILGEDRCMYFESLRLATGLAGCNHQVTVYTPLEPLQLRHLVPEAGSFFEVLSVMRSEFKVKAPERVTRHNVLLSL
ncbi:MAG: hypothetical protein HQM06_05890 [Magnetococcales bacterium]|nr:hypothetical protein [Magnetococcales bacterium]